jgi:hypothetical protein
MLDLAAFSVPPLQILVAHTWFSITGLRRCAPVTHQDQGLVYQAPSDSLQLPLAGNAGPRKPSVPRRVQFHRSRTAIAQIRGFA